MTAPSCLAAVRNSSDAGKGNFPFPVSDELIHPQPREPACAFLSHGSRPYLRLLNPVLSSRSDTLQGFLRTKFGRVL